MKKYTALFAALTLVLALAGCGAETQTPMPGQSEQEEFTQNSTENVNEKDGMTLLDLYHERISYFEKYADITIDEEGKELGAVVDELREILEERGYVLGSAPEEE